MTRSVAESQITTSLSGSQFLLSNVDKNSRRDHLWWAVQMYFLAKITDMFESVKICHLPRGMV